MASSIRSYMASGSTLMTVSGMQFGVDSTSAILAVIEEVGQALSHLPYIKPLCALILQIIKIRNVKCTLLISKHCIDINKPIRK
jgi:hypothetical protein